MTKRKHSSEIAEHIDTVFNLIFTAIGNSDDSTTLRFQQLKSKLLFESSEKTFKLVKKPATEFTIAEVVESFGLAYTNVRSQYAQHHWEIEELPETKGFEPTSCIVSLIDNYERNFHRSSEAVCRTAIDFILNECLTVMKGNQSGEQANEDSRPRTPNPLSDLKIYGEVSFTHKITPKANTISPSQVVVSGRVDHGIGRILKSTKTAMKRFHSLLLLVEAKHDRSVDQALPQLFVYLASLRQSRLTRHRSDASVYGVASDGYFFIFVTISHEGVVRLSRQFNILAGKELRVVLGCLKYLLEKTANMSPNLTPERGSGRPVPDGVDDADDGDDPIDLDDNDFMKPPNDEDDVEEEED